jgi:hypothetical protein
MTRVSYVTRENLDAVGRQAYDEEKARVGLVTNMKKAILHSPPAHQAYLGSYLIKAELIKLLGSRAFNVYAHAISSASDCLLCSTYFRRALAAQNISPASFEPTDEEQLLIDLGSTVGARAKRLDEALWSRLRQRYDERAIVNLIGYAGTMVATNIFNSLLEVDLDEYLIDPAQ